MSGGHAGGRLRDRRFDIAAAILGLLAALALFPLRLIASQIYIETIPIVLGVACVLYLLSVYSDRLAPGLPTLSRPVARLLPSLTFTGIAVLVVVAVEAGQRSLPFYALAGVVGTLLAVQVLFTHEEDYQLTLYLIQVVLLAAVVRYAALYTTPGLIGIDVWTHVTDLAASVHRERTLGAISDDKHFASPLYHLLVVETAILGDVGLRSALYLSLGLVMPFSALLVYMTANALVTERWAVFAALLYSVGDYVIEWGIHLIPTSHGLLFFLAVLYALVRTMQIQYRVRDFALLVFLTVAVILTHQVSSFITLVLIGSAVIAQFLLVVGLFDPPDGARWNVRKDPVNLVGLLVFDMGFIIFMWSLTPYNQDTFLETTLSYLRQTVEESFGFMNLVSSSGGGDGGSSAASAGPTVLQEVAAYLDTLGFLFLLLGTFVGCLYVVHRRRTRHSVFTLLVVSAVMLVFVLGLPMFGIQNFIPQRWFAFLYAPMAVLTVVGLRHLVRNLSPRAMTAGLLVFALVFPGAMIVSSDGTLDSPVFPEFQPRTAYTDQEIAAAESVGRMTGSPPSNSLLPREVIHTDQPYQTLFDRMDGGTYPARTAIVTANGTLENTTVTVYREYQTEGAPIFDFRSRVGRVHHVEEATMCPPDNAVLYANGDVKLCVDPRNVTDG